MKFNFMESLDGNNIIWKVYIKNLNRNLCSIKKCAIISW